MKIASTLKIACRNIKLIAIESQSLIARYEVKNNTFNELELFGKSRTAYIAPEPIIVGDLSEFTKLHIHSMQFNEFTKFTVANIQDVLRANSDLTDLDFYCSLENLTDEQLKQAFETLPPNLTILSVESKKTVSTSTVNTILENNPQLIKFDFNIMDDEELIRESVAWD